ncbi:von willebrand factor type A domain protein, partial (macronuclear) [Tetrahymena thermophila SB210]
ESISVELFWREVIQHWYKSNNSSLNEKLIEAYSLNIYNGFPFEIIDGETFYYPYEFLKKCFSHQLFTNKKFCIISIIGPQNSGKSTLLNYFLGCDFYVSEGRCTRGIYGTLVKSKVPQFDYILVIDSEGLLSQEKKDPDYDRKLTLFCLSVSQFLIINVKELTTEISNILELCIDVSTDLKTNKIPKKVVEIVFNQKGDPNNQNN